MDYCVNNVRLETQIEVFLVLLLSLQIKEGNWAGEMDHILLSYQRQYQKTVVRLRDALKSHGFTTWFDEDDMGESRPSPTYTLIRHYCLLLLTCPI